MTALLGRGERAVRRGVPPVVVDAALQVLSFVVAMLLVLALLSALGYDAGAIGDALWHGSAGSAVSLGYSLGEAVPLVLTATAVWLALQGGLFNIGGDGQLQVGGVAALVAVSHLGLGGSGLVLVPVALVVSAAAGAAWVGLAAALKAYRGTSEIVSTLMLNFVAVIAVGALVRGPLQSETNPYSPQTDPIPTGARLPDLLPDLHASWGVLLALGLAVLVLVVVRRTTTGLRLRAVGANPRAATVQGTDVRRYWLGSMLASGALCGLAGGLVLLGMRYYLAPGWAAAWGFQGVLITFLALRSAYLIPLWALLFGMLASAGPALKGQASVPDSVVTVMQVAPVVVLFLMYGALRTWSAWRNGRVVETEAPA